MEAVPSVRSSGVTAISSPMHPSSLRWAFQRRLKARLIWRDCRTVLNVMVLTMPAEQLCASGTVGIAAIGFAFGQPQRAITTRPTTTGRNSTVRGVSDESPMVSINSPSPSALPSTASVMTSRLRKRNSLGQPLSLSNRFSGEAYSSSSTQGGRLHNDLDRTDPSSSSALKRSSGSGTSALEVQGTGTAKSSWLKRMSTLSSLRSGSHDSTPPPGSPSLSYSNGSTALILPSTASEGPRVSPRNRLVKRTSSQKLLSGTSTPHSTLPRPATSHQRTLQQRYSSGEDLNDRSRFAQSIPFDVLREDHQAYDESLETWLPFFTTQAPTPTKDGFTRKRNSNSGANRREPIGSKIPNANGPPTLLLATSISSGVSHDVPEDSIAAPPRPNRRRPSTAIGFQTFIPPSTSNPEIEPSSKQDPISRRSFSIADMFPSPSPSTWKIPRSASLRRNKGSSGVPTGRRVSSAPLATTSSHSPSSASTEVGNLNPPKTRTLGRSRGGASGEPSSPLDELENPSSPLPPLNRISTFEIDLPTTAPSYPTSPPSGERSASPRISSAPSPLISSPLGPAVARNRSHRPSGAPSDRASTLLGSDNDNSRFLPSDEDEFDFRSDTVYDSTRTGATGSSHSGVRRPPIETIFDESPPTELPQHKLITLQDLLSNQSFVESNADTRRNAEADQGLSTPVRAGATCKEDEYPTTSDAANEPRLTDFPSSPPDVPLAVGSDRPENHHMDGLRDDEDWALENAEGISQVPRYHLSSNNDQSGPMGTSPRCSTVSPDTGPAGVESPPKANIFEWSEQSLADKESLQGSSPRPKTVHGAKTKETRSSRLSGRRGSSALHLRSQSVPVPPDGSGHRSHGTGSNLESWVLGNKGVSEDWDGDFDFEETHRSSKYGASGNDAIRSSSSSAMLIPRSILERQASVHGQFGQVKELTLLVEELQRLRQQASVQGIMHGQSAELWKEAEGIINLATLDDEEQEFLPPRSPLVTGLDFDAFDEDSPSSRRKSGQPSREDRSANADESPSSHVSPRSSQDRPKLDTPSTSRPRKESVAKAKSVLETIHQQRSEYDSTFMDARSSRKNFDTTSLRDLVTRAGVVTRALKEIVRRAENSPPAAKARPSTPQDPVFSQIFQHPPSSPSISKTPRVTQSPKRNSFRGGAIAGNDNEINGHMKMMTVV
ncbi:hypothetical protein MMC29_007793 [Sticta canariensis]|nr:hypothetical protein [Sticta canariensis]